MFDVLIIGGGIIGCALSYYLSQYDCTVALVEKENDVATGTTKANSAILHAGYDPRPGTLMAKTNVLGNALAKDLCRDLDVEFKICGSLVLAFSEEEKKRLHELMLRGQENGVPDLRILDSHEARCLEPNLAENVVAALYAPSAAVVNPWEWAIAMAEVADRNGVEFFLNNRVMEIAAHEAGETNRYYEVKTDRKSFQARIVVNCSGVHAAELHAMVAPESFKIEPTKGEYYLLDKSLEKMVSHVLFQCPNDDGKGVLVAPTMHGNIIVGPNAHKEEDAEDTSNTKDGLAFVRQKALRSVPDLDLGQNIRNFAGMRANCDRQDFVLEFAAPGFLDIAGIQSPGLTSAPALAKFALATIQNYLATGSLTPVFCEMKTSDEEYFRRCPNWQGKRSVIRFKHLPLVERQNLVSSQPAYGRVICRCETITEGEIIQALHSPLTPCSLDGIKRRCGTGMGRCQGGFCGPKIVEIIARERNCSPTEILQDREGSFLLTGETKEEF